MADRVLVWHQEDVVGDGARIGPTYYIEEDYEAVAVRIYAEKAAPDGDIEVDIFDDGVSIFPNTAPTLLHTESTWLKPPLEVKPAKTSVSLAKGTNESELVDNDPKSIDKGSWLHCEVTQSNGGRNITVSLELARI